MSDMSDSSSGSAASFRLHFAKGDYKTGVTKWFAQQTNASASVRALVANAIAQLGMGDLFSASFHMDLPDSFDDPADGPKPVKRQFGGKRAEKKNPSPAQDKPDDGSSENADASSIGQEESVVAVDEKSNVEVSEPADASVENDIEEVESNGSDDLINFDSKDTESVSENESFDSMSSNIDESKVDETDKHKSYSPSTDDIFSMVNLDNASKLNAKIRPFSEMN